MKLETANLSNGIVDTYSQLLNHQMRNQNVTHDSIWFTSTRVCRFIRLIVDNALKPKDKQQNLEAFEAMLIVFLKDMTTRQGT